MTEQVNRGWGHYVVDDYTSPTWKIKTLVVYPNRTLSYQQHKDRGEIWLIKEGKGTAIIDDEVHLVKAGDIVTIKSHQWHQLINGTNDTLVVHEIQHGSRCIEEDIERYE